MFCFCRNAQLDPLLQLFDQSTQNDEKQSHATFDECNLSIDKISLHSFNPPIYSHNKDRFYEDGLVSRMESPITDTLSMLEYNSFSPSPLPFSREKLLEKTARNENRPPFKGRILYQSRKAAHAKPVCVRVINLQPRSARSLLDERDVLELFSDLDLCSNDNPQGIHITHSKSSNIRQSLTHVSPRRLRGRWSVLSEGASESPSALGSQSTCVYIEFGSEEAAKHAICAHYANKSRANGRFCGVKLLRIMDADGLQESMKLPHSQDSKVEESCPQGKQDTKSTKYGNIESPCIKKKTSNATKDPGNFVPKTRTITTERRTDALNAFSFLGVSQI